jgi:hypothetical protein
MHSRWYSVTVVFLWLAAMTWLVVYKVLPPLLVGEQPSFPEMLEAQQRELPVAWRLSLNGRKLGWAISATSQLPDGSTQIRSRVHFDHLPVEQFMRGWLIRQAFRVVEPPAIEVEMDTRSILVFDADDRLSGFESEVWLGSARNVIRVEGTVEGNNLLLSIHSADLPDPPTLPPVRIPPHSMVGDALSPQTRMPGLRVGQSWTTQSYNPLRPDNPWEVVQAEVESVEPIVWGNQTEEARLVVFRRDSGFGLLGRQPAPRGRLWVRSDGMVLRQEVVLLDSTLVFDRYPSIEEAGLAGKLDEEWRESVGSE